MRAIQKGYTQMRDVKVKKSELIEVVRKNREKHVSEYDEAVEGYKEQAIAAIKDSMSKLRRQVEELKAGEKIRLSAVSFNLAVPENHAKDYDQVIKMLEMSVDEELTIRSDEFACYVMDDWGWRNEFDAVTANYTSNKSR